MLNPLNASSSLDEVVFANRNKAYGAYAIRKQYDANVLKSLSVVFAAFILLLLLSFTIRKPVPGPVLTNPDDQTVHLTTINLEDLSQPASGAPATSQAPRTTQTDAPNYRIEDQHVTNTQTPPAITNNDQANTGSGLTATTPVSGTFEGTNGNPLLNVAPGPEPLPLTNEPFIITDEMPLFNNGVGDLVSYLSKEINYPERALAANVSGKVYVIFDVSRDGSVTNIRIERGIGFGCDEEAIRVVSKMPRWKPGVQNGKAVPVRMRLPIKFETR